MKRTIMLVSAVTAAMILVGCGGGSGGVPSSVNAPSFATQDATVDSPEKASSAVAAVAVGGNPGSNFPHSLTATQFATAIIQQKQDTVVDVSSFIDKYKQEILKGKSIPSFAMRAKQDFMKKIKPMEINTSRCPEEDELIDKSTEWCNVSGEATVHWTVKAVGNECVYKEEITAKECKWDLDEGSEIDRGSADGTLAFETHTVIDEINATTIYEYEVLIKDTYKYAYAGTIYEKPMEDIMAEEEPKYEYEGKWNITFEGKEDYHINEFNSFVDDRVFHLMIKGDLTDKEYAFDENGTKIEKWVWELNSDYTLTVDSSKFSENNLTIAADGWIDEYLKYKSQESSFDIAYKNFNLEVHAEGGVLDMNINGKLGKKCIGGLVMLETQEVIEDNTTDSYELPNDGLLKVTGANDTFATVEFFQDESGTHAKVTTSEGNETIYDTADEMVSDACKGKFVNPGI